ncbi:hypothetical protein M0802_016653 [Mischocyttarus mexicanus]|nr:hypothetical protein M0802_016653 [Mischocyttarus mexicanus]
MENWIPDGGSSTGSVGICVSFFISLPFGKPFSKNPFLFLCLPIIPFPQIPPNSP